MFQPLIIQIKTTPHLHLLVIRAILHAAIMRKVPKTVDVQLRHFTEMGETIKCSKEK